MKITVKEAAKLARVSQSTIYSLLRKGQISAKRFGATGRGCWRIESEEFDKWMESCKQEPAVLTPLKHIN